MRRLFLLFLSTLAIVSTAPAEAQTSDSARVDSILTHGVATRVHLTEVDENRNDVLILSNGAIVEVTSGSLSYLGYRTKAALISSGYTCRIWIQGKRTYRCDIVRGPRDDGVEGRLTFIADVRGDGAILELGTGLYEVPFEDYITAIWCCGEALLIGDSQLINLDTGDPPITVTRLR